jgi:Berberine and berberine like
LRSVVSAWPLQANDGKLQREAFFAKSDLFKRPLGRQAIGTILRSIEDAREVPGLAHARVTFDAFGGAIKRFNPGETAFFHRDTLFSAQYLAFWPENAPLKTARRGMAWLRRFHGAMRPFASGAAYVNYIDPELRDWPQAYYGSGFQRLVRVKAQYRP